MEDNLWYHSTSICPFESGKCEKEGQKLQKFEYIKNKKSFLEIYFHNFWKEKTLWKVNFWYQQIINSM